MQRESTPQLPRGGSGGTWACVYKASYDLKKILALFTVAVAVALCTLCKTGWEKNENENEKKEKLWQIISAKEYENIYSYIVAAGGAERTGNAAHCWPNLIRSKVERAALRADSTHKLLLTV